MTVRVYFRGVERPDWLTLLLHDTELESALTKPDIDNAYTINVFPDSANLRNEQVRVVWPFDPPKDVTLRIGEYDNYTGIGAVETEVIEGCTYKTQLCSHMVEGPENAEELGEVWVLTLTAILGPEDAVPQSLIESALAQIEERADEIERVLQSVQDLGVALPMEVPQAAAAAEQPPAAAAPATAASEGIFAEFFRGIDGLFATDTTGRLTRVTREVLEGPALGSGDTGPVAAPIEPPPMEAPANRAGSDVWVLYGHFESMPSRSDFKLWDSVFSMGAEDSPGLSTEEQIRLWAQRFTLGSRKGNPDLFNLSDEPTAVKGAVAVAALVRPSRSLLSTKHLIVDELQDEQLWIVTGHEGERGWLKEPDFMLVIQKGSKTPLEYIRENNGPRALLHLD